MRRQAPRPTFATSARILCCLLIRQTSQQAGSSEDAGAGASVIIFDCNGVLVDSEPIAAAVAAEEFNRIGIPLTPEMVTRYFFGRRPADMFATVETVTRRRLPADFATSVAVATLKRLRSDLRAMP